VISRINRTSLAFTLLLGLLAAVPTFGIDVILPTLSATGVALGASPSEVGAAMSVYLLSLATTLLAYGPLSDRFGRKPIAVFGSVLMIVASIGCMFSRSLLQLLVFRALQGAGASGPGTAAITMIRDLFEGEAARAKMSYVVFAINIVPMVAPTVGAALLAIGGWQAIYLAPIAAGLVVLLAIRGVSESARIDPGTRLKPAAIARDYARVLMNPVCLGNILCNAGAAGAVFAYISGSPLFFIDALGLTPNQYGLIFGASSLSVIGGTFVNSRLGSRGVSPSQMIMIGLTLSLVLATLLLVATLAGVQSIALVVLAMIGVALSFGLISPNAVNAAMQPVPMIAGSAAAVVVFVQLLGAGSSSALVAGLFDGHSSLSMAAVMFSFCIFAICAYAFVARPAEARASAIRLGRHGAG
jgi:MFS transporter, DHA1 family, multidrug resistance protein